MSQRFTLREAAERIVSRFAADCTDAQAQAAWGATLAEACRHLERGAAHDALVILGRNIPAMPFGTAERIRLCRLHPSLD